MDMQNHSFVPLPHEKKLRMLGLEVPETKITGSSCGARENSPDSVIFAQGANVSLFSSASGSGDRCSFESDVHDHEWFAYELSKHLAGFNHHNYSHGQDSFTQKNFNHNKSRVKSQGSGAAAADCIGVQTPDPTKHTFSQALKECQKQRLRTEALNHDRQRPASLDLNNRGFLSNASSPRLMGMKNSSISSRRSATSFPSPTTPNNRHGNLGIQKGWSSERVPLPTNSNRSYAHAVPLLLNAGKGLPSKWEDAEKWIFSPAVAGEGGGTNKTTLPPPSQRRPKSKSGPLGTPGNACYLSPYSPSMTTFDGCRIGNFPASSPFSPGLSMIGHLSNQVDHGSGNNNVAPYTVNTETCIVRSASVHGWSDLPNHASSPCSQDEQNEIKKNAVSMMSHVASRRDMATQMSPDSSTQSSPKNGSSSHSSSIIQLEELPSHHISKLEVRDVPVDDQVSVMSWSKKYGALGFDESSSDMEEWKKNAFDTQASSWNVAETAKCILKLKREEAKIAAWENLQKEKAEAEIRKLEIKLEKMKTTSMAKIMKKLKSAQRKARDMRGGMLLPSKTQQGTLITTTITTTHDETSYIRKTPHLSSLSGCFTCRSF